MLRSRREIDIDAHAIFVDLVKAHGSMKYDVISLFLEKMGALDRHEKWAGKLHGDFNVIPKAGKEEIRTKGSCEIRQGDNLASTVLIIVIQLEAEDFIKHEKIKSMPTPIIKI